MRRQMGAVFAAATIVLTSFGTAALSAPAYAAGCQLKTAPIHEPVYDQYGGEAYCDGGSDYVRAAVQCIAEDTEKTYTIVGDRVWSDWNSSKPIQLSFAWCHAHDARKKYYAVVG